MCNLSCLITAAAASILIVGAFEDEKSFKICNVLGGLDITRLVSSNTRNFFKGAIEDVELIREVVSESATDGGITGGFSDLAQMNNTLDWKSRNLPEGTTTIEADLGYVDDRLDRRMERFVSLAENKPFVGNKANDMGIVDTVSNIFPWIIDRKSKEKNWWLSHQNGKSEGSMKDPFLFDSLYTAAWIGSYGEAWAYYPPMHVYGHPLTFGDILGSHYNSHEEAFVKPNLPENNPERKAFFTTPYPDSAIPGMSLLTAMAPVYFTGVFKGVSYSDTYIASTGVDIAVSSVSSLLDVLEKLTKRSFGMLVDSKFNTIVISQSVVKKIYPERTGFEEERVTIDKSDGSIISDRRNMTYQVSDTIIQPLTNLTNANWSSLLSSINELNPGERGYSTLDIQLTKKKYSTSFYVMYEKWEYVADWVLLVFVPVSEVENAISVNLQTFIASNTSEISLEAVKGRTLNTEVHIVNSGTLDVIIVPKKKPKWIEINLPMDQEHVLTSGETLHVKFNVYTETLGTSTDLVSFLVQDYNYPDCFHNDNLNVPISLKVVPKSCDDPNTVANLEGNCVCADQYLPVGGKCVSYGAVLSAIIFPSIIFIVSGIFVYFKFKVKKEDSVWVVNPSDIYFKVPPVVLGRGTFGLVLLAEYRGTNVAVKRVIPPRDSRKTSVTEDSGDYDNEALQQPVDEPQSQSEHPPISEIHINQEETASRKLSIGNATRRSSLSNMGTSTVRDIFTFSDKGAEGEIVNNQEIIERRSSVFSKASRKASIDNVSRKSSMDTTDTSVVKRKLTISDIIPENNENTTSGGMNTEALKSGATAISHSGTFNGLKSGGLNFYHESNSSDAKYFNIKNIFRRKEDEYSRLKADFIEEMRHLSKLRHPCITTVMGAVISKKEEPMLVMECMDHGSLYDLLHNDTMIIEGDFVLSILRDVAQGLVFLHSATPKVIHGDLKAQNVLVDMKFRAKVADFGLSQKKKMGATGTPLWMAPELLRGEATNNATTDVYSFGIILYEVYSRQNPYEGEDHLQVLRDVCNPKINKRPAVPKTMPAAMVSLMTDCVHANPESRPTMDEIVSRLKRLDSHLVEPGSRYVSMQIHKMQEASRNEDLLLEVFPKHIAEALRDGRKVEPEHHDCVTIYFSDIVGFTTISGVLPPIKVSDMLDRLYLRFDDLSTKHGVWKIETIGDAWMGVTNLVCDQSSDHASRIARFSIDAIQAASETLIDLDNEEMGYVRIRVGMHSGPVLSNVVGSRTPKFSIFGDTVNVSSRMESTSIPLYIQSSEPAAELLMKQDPTLPIVCRGNISVKGKGEMTTYWVNQSECPQIPC